MGRPLVIDMSTYRFSIHRSLIVSYISVKLDSNESGNIKEDFISIKVDESVNLTFALRYLNMFTKASQLSDQVSLN